MMTRRQKISLLIGIIKGETSIYEALDPQVVVVYQDPSTGEFKPFSPYQHQDPLEDSAMRAAELYDRAKNDPSITVIKVVRV